MSITVLHPGMLTTIQDQGRIGYQQFGVPVSGTVDPRSAAVANILAGNEESEAVLECTVMGPQLRFDEPAVIAIAGADLGPTLDGVPMTKVIPPCENKYLLCAGRKDGLLPVFQLTYIHGT